MRTQININATISLLDTKGVNLKWSGFTTKDQLFIQREKLARICKKAGIEPVTVEIPAVSGFFF